jgi:hypothetical protein
MPNGSPARRTVSEDPAHFGGHNPMALTEQKVQQLITASLRHRGKAIDARVLWHCLQAALFCVWAESAVGPPNRQVATPRLQPPVQSAPPGSTLPASTVDLASALAEANAWMALSRGGARGGSAGDLAAAAGNAAASPLLQPEDAVDAHGAVALEAGSSAAAQPSASAAELQTALSMIDEDEPKEGSGTGLLPRLQPRQLTVGGAPRKASDAMVHL